MKKLKKFVALLLVGVMALALLTACGGGSNVPGNPEEQKMMDTIKQSSQGKGIKENDPGSKLASLPRRAPALRGFFVFGGKLPQSPAATAPSKREPFPAAKLPAQVQSFRFRQSLPH